MISVKSYMMIVLLKYRFRESENAINNVKASETLSPIENNH